MKKALVAALVLAIASLGLVACGGGSDSTSSEATSGGAESGETAGGGETGGKEAEGGTAGTASELAVEADPNGELAFTQEELAAKAGKVTVDFTNQASVPHNVAIESENGEQLGETEIIDGGSDSAVVDLPKGTYTFYCTVPGHRQAGMEGTLVVK